MELGLEGQGLGLMFLFQQFLLPGFSPLLAGQEPAQDEGEGQVQHQQVQFLGQSGWRLPGLSGPRRAGRGRDGVVGSRRGRRLIAAFVGRWRGWRLRPGAAGFRRGRFLLPGLGDPGRFRVGRLHQVAQAPEQQDHPEGTPGQGLQPAPPEARPSPGLA